MTLGEWLDERTPAPPPRLAARIGAVLGDRVTRDSNQAPVLFVDAAEELLRDLLARPSAGRASALDLLTVDALVTYAFEAASDAPETVSDLSTLAMTRLALGSS